MINLMIRVEIIVSVSQCLVGSSQSISESMNLIGFIIAFYLPKENSYASVHMAHHV